MDCRSCSATILSEAQFCHACGDTAALLELDDDAKLHYCSKCFSRLQGERKYCVHCGEASPHAGVAGARNSLWDLLQNPRVQFAVVGCLAALVLIPTVSIMLQPEPEKRGSGGIAEENKARRAGRPQAYSLEQASFDFEDGDRPAAGVAVDSQGNYYVSDVDGHRVYKITREGKASVYAGVGEPGYSGDGGPAVMARLNRPRGLAVDARDNLLIADSGNGVIRIVDPRSRQIRSMSEGPSGIEARAGGAPEQGLFHEPTAVYVGPEGRIYVSESPCSSDPTRPTMWVLEPVGESVEQSRLAPPDRADRLRPVG